MLAREKEKIDFVKIKPTDIDKEEIDLIKLRTHNIIGKIQNGEYGNFSNNNIDTPHQKDIHKQIENKFGVYKSLRFESLFKSKKGNPIINKIYLFKGDFAFKKDIEIRVVLNDKKEIIRLNIMSWEKEYFNYL